MSTTSSTPDVGPRARARRSSLRRPDPSGPPADPGDRRDRLGRTLGIVALAGLLGLTSWFVASVSTWLVPVYVTAMVFIFVSPRTQPPGGPEGVGDGGADARGPATGKEPAKGAPGPSRPAPNPNPAPTRGAASSADGTPAAPARGTDPSASGPAAAKPRRPRGRARKPAKPGAEPAAAAAPVTWIRVGPGKFVRADSQAQAADPPPRPDPPVEPSPAPTAGEGPPQDSPEPTVPFEGPAQADAPALAGPIEPGPSLEFPAHSDHEEVVAVADPVPDPPPVTAQEPRADEASEESNPLEPPGAGAIDQAMPADPPGPEPDPEEYGIAPSAFGPDLPAAPSESDDREGDPACPTDHADAGAEDLAGIENETEDEPSPPIASEQAWAGDPGLMPEASGPLSAPVGIGPEGESLRGGVTGRRSLRVRLAPDPGADRAAGRLAGSGVSRLARNLRPGRGRRGFARRGSGASPRLRADTRRNPGRPARFHHGFRARSPPLRP